MRRLWQHKWWMLAVLAGLWWVRPRARYEFHCNQFNYCAVLDRWTGDVRRP